MATIERRNNRFRLIFYHIGKRYAASLKTDSQREADAIAGSVERTLQLLEQRVLTAPEGSDLVNFVLSGGNVFADQEVQRLPTKKCCTSWSANTATAPHACWAESIAANADPSRANPAHMAVFFSLCAAVSWRNRPRTHAAFLNGLSLPVAGSSAVPATPTCPTRPGSHPGGCCTGPFRGQGR